MSRDRLSRLRDACERNTTGGLVPAFDGPRREEVLRALADLCRTGNTTNAHADGYAAARLALDWWGKQAVLAETQGEGRTPADVADLVHDLSRLEYAQRTIDRVREGRGITGDDEGDVTLDEAVRDALLARVERWMRESRERRRREITARADAKAGSA